MILTLSAGSTLRPLLKVYKSGQFKDSPAPDCGVHRNSSLGPHAGFTHAAWFRVDNQPEMLRLFKKLLYRNELQYIFPPIRAPTIQDRSYWIECCTFERPTTQSMVPESTSTMTLWFSACSIIQQATPRVAFTATTYLCLLLTTWTINQRPSIGTLRTTELMLSCQCWKVQCINEVFQDVSLHVHMCAFYRCWRLKHLGCADLIEDRCVRMTPYFL